MNIKSFIKYLNKFPEDTEVWTMYLTESDGEMLHWFEELEPDNHLEYKDWSGEEGCEEQDKKILYIGRQE